MLVQFLFFSNLILRQDGLTKTKVLFASFRKGERWEKLEAPQTWEIPQPGLRPEEILVKIQVQIWAMEQDMDKQEKFSSDLKEADNWLLTPGQMQGCEALCLLGSLAGPRHHAGCWSMCHPFPSYSLVRHRETLSWAVWPWWGQSLCLGCDSCPWIGPLHGTASEWSSECNNPGARNETRYNSSRVSLPTRQKLTPSLNSDLFPVCFLLLFVSFWFWRKGLHDLLYPCCRDTVKPKQVVVCGSDLHFLQSWLCYWEFLSVPLSTLLSLGQNFCLVTNGLFLKNPSVLSSRVWHDHPSHRWRQNFSYILWPYRMCRDHLVL